MTGRYPVRVAQSIVCWVSHIHRKKAHPACFSSGGAPRSITKNVPPVGTAGGSSDGSGAAITGNFAFSSRYRRNAVLVQIRPRAPPENPGWSTCHAL